MCKKSVVAFLALLSGYIQQSDKKLYSPGTNNNLRLDNRNDITKAHSRFLAD